jgi:hypothetical protein
LGTLLFLLHFDDLPLIFQGVNFVLYAYDTNILVVNKEEEVFQHKIAFVMQQLEICFHKINLIVNIENTIAISFYSHHNRHPCRLHIKFNRNEIA